MTREEAIAWYHEITSGSGVDRQECLDVVRRGTMAVKMWNEPEFAYGVEYGVLIALVKAFGLTNENLGYK